MRFAYADPPYLGMAVKFYSDHPEAAVYDSITGHKALIDRLCAEFPDGWAYSLHMPSLRSLLPLTPDKTRVGAWTKPWCSFKPWVNPAYAWEPVFFHGGRKMGADTPTVRDFCAVNIAMERGLKGAKPEGFCFWVFDMLGMQPDDEFVDVFHGSGAVTRAWEKWRRIKSGQIAVTPNLFEGGE